MMPLAQRIERMLAALSGPDGKKARAAASHHGKSNSDATITAVAEQFEKDDDSNFHVDFITAASK